MSTETEPPARAAGLDSELIDALVSTRRFFTRAEISADLRTLHKIGGQARAMVVEGVLGDIRLVQAEYAQDWLSEPIEESGQKQASWRTDPARSGAGGCVGVLDVLPEDAGILLVDADRVAEHDGRSEVVGDDRVEVLDVEGTREVVSQVVAGTPLQRLAVGQRDGADGPVGGVEEAVECVGDGVRDLVGGAAGPLRGDDLHLEIEVGPGARLHRCIVTPGRCSDMAGSPIASMKAER